jgi:hypothetical protein
MAERPWSEAEHNLAARLLALHNGSFEQVIATGRLGDHTVKALRQQW